MRKIIALSLALTMVFVMCGCESSDIKEAKECIDQIYENTNALSMAQIELSRDPGNDKLTRDIAMYERFIDAGTTVLENIYIGLSEKGQQEVSDYVAEAGLRNIVDIWS